MPFSCRSLHTSSLECTGRLKIFCRNSSKSRIAVANMSVKVAQPTAADAKTYPREYAIYSIIPGASSGAVKSEVSLLHGRHSKSPCRDALGLDDRDQDVHYKRMRKGVLRINDLEACCG